MLVAQCKGSIHTLLCSCMATHSGNQEKSDPWHPVSHTQHCLWAAVLPQHPDLDLCLTHMLVFFLKTFLQNNAECFQNSQVCISTPLEGRMTKLLSDSAVHQQPFGVQNLKSSAALQTLGEHFMFLSTICWYFGHLHLHCRAQHLRLLFQREGQALPSPQQLLNKTDKTQDYFPF